MTRLVGCLAVLALTCGALAEGPPSTYNPVSDSGIRVGGGGSRGIAVYSNAQTSVGIIGYELPNIGVVLADQLHMTAGGVLDELSFAVAVYYNTESLTGIDATIWIGDANDPENWLYNFTTQQTFPGGIANGQHAVVTLTGLAPQNYVLPQDIILGVNYANPVGQLTGNIGQAVFGPPTIGTSEDFILYGDAYGLPLTPWSWPAYSPNNNFYYRVVVVGEAPPCRGDANCDNVVSFGDINPFVLALSDFNAWRQQFPNCPVGNVDVNGDGQVNFGDINPFVAILSAGGGPC